MKVLHLGLGRFHKAHQAWYFDRLGGWPISAWSMRSREASRELADAGYRYELEIRSTKPELVTISVIRETGFALEDRALLRERFEDIDLALITLTVTEKGYCLGPDGSLDLAHPAIVADLLNPDEPSSAVGILAWGLRARALRARGPITVLSCDNLASNGAKLQAAITRFLEQKADARTMAWIAGQASFPNTMVDRIVPAGGPLMTEPFSQWVIEDHFRGEKPALDSVGALFVDDVAPYEERKLRLLNASHSAIAYLGLLRGHAYVHEAISDPTVLSLVRRLHAEVIPLLTSLAEREYRIYCDEILARFSNDRLPHKLEQIAMDGTQKLPQRVFPSLLRAREQRATCSALMEVVRAWLHYLYVTSTRTPEQVPDPLNDPLADTIRNAASGGEAAFVEKMLLEPFLKPLSSRFELPDFRWS